MEKNRPYKILISGGGTGGHIYPAIAIADTIKRRSSNAEILFVGAKDRMEMQKVPEAGYKIEGLWISGIKRELSVDNLSFPFKLISSLSKASKIVKDFKPDAVVGVGGFASGPVLYVAASKKIPTVIQEQNSYPGITNKLLKNKVNTICVAHEGMDKFFPKNKIVFTGNPVRKDISDAADKREKAKEFFKLQKGKKTVLIIGGSLGARTINQSILGQLQKLMSADVDLIWQTGRVYYKNVQEQLSEADLQQIRLFEFLKDMDLAYAAADVVISRAGALSISELCLVKKPVIFVPSPNVTEDHQTKNAMALVNTNAAWMVKDAEAREILVDTIIKLLKDPCRQEALSENIALLARPNAAEDIVNEIFKLIR